jgi:fucose 4-O-acetylase-like acetyltransferase
MTKTRLPFLDWMKCLGILLIVFGHVGGRFIDHLTPPIYPKQLGVAFFLFALGFSLARETRGSREVLFNRLFEMYLFGIACALVMSAYAYLQASRLAASNYLPFLLGSNVVFNHFPANPTTWFIGMYLHVLLVWALILRGVRIRPWMILLAGLAEIVIRATLMETRGLYVAYVLLPNWATVFLLGLFYGQRQEETPPAGLALRLGCAIGLGLLVSVWPEFLNGWLKKESFDGEFFPFKRFQVDPAVAELGVTSVAVTALYLFYTWLTFQLTRRLPDFALVRFVARNTLIIFIVHMPIYVDFGIRDRTIEWTSNPLARLGLRLLFCLVLPAVGSEIICRLVRPKALRDRLWRLYVGKQGTRDLEKVGADGEEKVGAYAPERVGL